MNQSQRRLAHDLLKTGLSQRGYMTATQVMELEKVLAALENAQPLRLNRFVRDPERYFFSIFGSPSTQNTWGWRVEGHHMSLHFTVVDGKLVAGSPSFFGSNPAEVREGPRKGTRVLGPEEDAARSLIESLDASQREKAIINTTAPNDIVTMASVKIDPLSPVGIPASALTATQRRTAEEADRRLHRQDGRRHRRAIAWRASRRPDGKRWRSPGPDRSSADRSTTTACRDRHF